MADMPVEQARRIVGERVETFARNLRQYTSPEYKEAQLRREFLDPLFEALGWDVTNRQGWAEQYKEVINEDAVRIGGATKAPDYAFRIGGIRKFFVEAKKPSLALKTDAASAYQLRRYAWSAKLPLSILSDFQELAIYDCRARPAETDKASVGRINYFAFEQYLDRWSEIQDLFSKDAIQRGSLDRFLIENKGKRGTTPVDAEFLKEIESWRVTLARNIAQLNPRLNLDEMNDAVQRTIDRIIFLRMAEDRGTEEYGQLQRLAQKSDIYAGLVRLCRQADDRYNSGLFDFQADSLTPGLNIDDEKLRSLLGSLYFPKSPYELSVLGGDTLGNVYEQFLGKVIRLTPAHQAKVEDKPEVKKAGGVFYTPAYIVDYIVAQTVGKLVAGKSPQEMVSVRVLDPACGSGSFLLGAFQRLLDHYLVWYSEHADAPIARDRIFPGAQGWMLTTAEKKRILTTHIFGVDIDRQAVEVTKLSLLLKVLEGENQETLGKQLSLFKERALPNLDWNIKCGNSLIGPDYFAGQVLNDPDQVRRVNPFDWAREFPEARRAGGFDCIIGNPPYVRIQMMKEWAPLEVEIYKQQYSVARSGNYDIYVVFVEKGLSLLNAHGRLGFILPHKFFNAQYGELLRGLIAGGKHLAHIVHFGDQQVFAGATTYTALMFLDKAGSDVCELVKVNDLAAWRTQGQATSGTIPAASITHTEWNFNVGANAALFERLSQMPVKLGDMADIFVGLQTSADKVFIMDFIEESPKVLRLKSKSLDCEWNFEKGLLFPLVSGTDVKRYAGLPERQYILFPYNIDSGSVELIDFDVLQKQYPKTASYLAENKRELEDRENGKFKGKQWYRFGRNQNIGIQNRVKICIPRLVETLRAAYDSKGNHFLDNVDVGGVTLRTEYVKQKLEYLLALLNSNLLRWYFPLVSAPFRGGWMSANRQFVSRLPIRAIDFANVQDKACHDTMVVLVTQMLDLHKRLPAAQTAHDRELLARQITATDQQIDALVYELYGLTQDEIALVEGKAQDK